ncbi:MAG: nucleotidyltransferase family protein [Candidatus Aminicenantes bacterium]|nr:nucleotidyltransferase family protein [Candidatus Aminicenantes bacterium]
MNNKQKNLEKELKKIENILKEVKPFLKKKYKVKDLGIFGSFVRGEQKKNSDLDILVEFHEVIGLFKFLELEEYLEELLNIKIDLVSKKALKPRIGKYILREVIMI